MKATVKVSVTLTRTFEYDDDKITSEASASNRATEKVKAHLRPLNPGYAVGDIVCETTVEAPPAEEPAPVG